MLIGFPQLVRPPAPPRTVFNAEMWICDVQDTIRCEPISATTLTIVAIAATVASTGVAIAAAMQQADDQARAQANARKAAMDAAEYNRKLADRNATIAQQQAEADALMLDRQNQQKLGAMEAAYGASGVTLEGTPLDVLASSASGMELDKQTIEYKGKLRALGYNDQSALETARGRSAASADVGSDSGLMTAAGVLVGGVGKGYDRWTAGQARTPTAAPTYNLGTAP